MFCGKYRVFKFFKIFFSSCQKHKNPVLLVFFTFYAKLAFCNIRQVPTVYKKPLGVMFQLRKSSSF